MNDRPQTPRLVAIDVARSIALAGMILYHFVYDLTHFGVLPAHTATTGYWAVFARSVAGSFIFLAGVSLLLAHSNGYKARPFFLRLLKLLSAASAITLITYLAVPSRYVYFGILHSIAVSSCIGLAFLRAPVVLTLLAAIVAYSVSDLTIGSYENFPALVWTGLIDNYPPSMDFEPTFPWLAPFLLGLGLAKAATIYGVVDRLRSYISGHSTLLAGVAWTGRHSLFIYLIHQPILIGLTYVISKLVLR